MSVSDREEGTRQIPKQWELDPIALNLKIEVAYFFQIQTSNIFIQGVRAQKTKLWPIRAVKTLNLIHSYVFF